MPPPSVRKADNVSKVFLCGVVGDQFCECCTYLLPFCNGSNLRLGQLDNFATVGQLKFIFLFTSVPFWPRTWP